MNTRRIVFIVLFVTSFGMLCETASAFYAPHMGRFVNRDPGGRLESLRLGVLGPAKTSHSFSFRNAVTEMVNAPGYLDGFNLYQYVRSQPMNYVDPSGLYRGSWPNNEGDGTPTCIKRCCRPIDTTGFTPRQKIGAAIAGDHCLLTQFGGPNCEDYKCGYGLTGTESKGDKPTPEGEGKGRGFDAITACNSCGGRPTPLKYGTGKGKTGETATNDELMDCIRNRPATCDYSLTGYNCHHWNNGASQDCGLDCRPKVGEPLWEPPNNGGFF